MSWVRFPSPAPTFPASIRTEGCSLKGAGLPEAVCHQTGLRVLTNDPGIDISAAPPELGSGKLHFHTTPTLPRSSDLADRLGPDRDLI